MSKDNYTLDVGYCLQNGKYKIISIIGQGGFGITYLAEQTGLGMKVAIKEFFMKGSCQRDQTTSEVSVPVNDNEELVLRCKKKFKSEARKIASLNNDHIVNIIDVFDENGTSYYVMKYLAGGSVASILKSGAMPERTAVKIISDIADALNTVHSNGLLHLDIKPANILLDESGRVVLIDFGVSKYVDSQKDSSTTSSLIGFSRGFAPLEQVNSTISSLSPATDIYALGATLYNLVTGNTPPEASIIMETGVPEMPGNISGDVKKAVTQAMQPKRKDRPQTIDAFLKLLPEEEIKDDHEDTVVVTAVVDKGTKEPAGQKSRLPVIITAFASALAVVFAVLFFIGKGGDSVNKYKGDNYAVVQQLESQLDSVRIVNNNLTKELRDRGSSEDGVEARINELESRVSELNAKNTVLTNENKKLRGEVESYRSDAERWRRQIQMLN